MCTNHPNPFVRLVLFYDSVQKVNGHQKVVTLHIWQEYMEEADHLGHPKSNPIKNQKGFGMRPSRNLFVYNS